jgi:hypothetical protein
MNLTNAQCADCGGSIVLVNATTAAADGWERYECKNCHRYLAIRLPPPPPAPVPKAVTP